MKHLVNFLLILLSLLWTHCTDSIDENDNNSETGNLMRFSTTVTSRGTPINSQQNMTDMGVFCSYTSSSNWSTSSTLNKMFNTKLISAPGNIWTYAGSPVSWNSITPTDKYTFFACAPYANASNGITISGNSSSTGIPSLSYTVPTTTANQPDLMMAVPIKNTTRTSLPIIFTMNHALACVGFQIGGLNQERITKISISGVYTSANASVDGSAIAWSNLSSQGTFAPIINYDAGKNYRTVTGTMSTNLISDNGYLMMIPQTLTSSSILTVTFGDGSTENFPLNKVTTKWDPGNKYIYKITTSNITFTSFTPTSNCYVVSPNATTVTGFSFPAPKRVNEYCKTGSATTIGYSNHANALNATDEWYGEIIWADFDYSSKVTLVHAAGRKTGTGVNENMSIILSPGTYQGNMVVALWKDANKNQVKDSSEPYLWSWHIWISTLANGRGSINQTNNSFPISSGAETSFIALNRNLGARASLPTAQDPNGCYGNYYQWGRKDPFPSSPGFSGSLENTIYRPTTDGTYGAASGLFGSTGFGVKQQLTSATTMDISIDNPLTFYGIGSIPYSDWLQTGSGITSLVYRWNSQSNLKTILDPCPYGWRVPTKGNWISFLTTEYVTNYNSTGVNGNYYNNQYFFPATGFRYYTSVNSNWNYVNYVNYVGNIGELNSTGSYWSSDNSIYANISYAAYFSATTVTRSINPKSMGLPVRPVLYITETP